jgi:hypothetical protein
MKAISVLMLMLVLLPRPTNAGQIVAGSLEDKSYKRIAAESDSDTRLQLLLDFETQFPHSKILPDVCIHIVNLYRQKGDRIKVIEYGEKALKLDDHNVMAMMVLARNYALEGRELDRALSLAQQSVDLIVKLKGNPMPLSYTEAEWKDYLQSTEAASRGILLYVTAVRSHLANQKEK